MVRLVKLPLYRLNHLVSLATNLFANLKMQVSLWTRLKLPRMASPIVGISILLLMLTNGALMLIKLFVLVHSLEQNIVLSLQIPLKQISKAIKQY